MAANLDFAGLASNLLSRARELLPVWLPGGRVVGSEYVCGSILGGPGDSFQVNLKTGRWKEFAGDEKGGDLIALYSAIYGVAPGVAFRDLSTEYDAAPASSAPPPEPIDEKIAPPPHDAPAIICVHSRFGKPSAVWAIPDENGRAIHYVARYETGPDSKVVLPWVWSWRVSHWICKAYPSPRPLYGLDALARNPNRAVLVVEGEKCKDAAQALVGDWYVVVSSTGGAGAVEKADWTPIKGRRVIVWPDADEPGEKAARRVSELTLALSPEVKIIDASGQPEGWDAVDAVAAGWDREKWRAWATDRVVVCTKAEPPAPFDPPLVSRLLDDLAGPPADLMAWEPDGEEKIAGSITPQGSAVAPKEIDAGTVWDLCNLKINGRGYPIANLDNVLRVLERWDRFQGQVWYDEFLEKVVTTWGDGKPKPWTDVMTLHMTAFFQRRLDIPDLKKDTLLDAVIAFAHSDTRNGPKDYMNRKALGYDNIPRIDMFFHDALGADDNEYTRAASANFFKGMVARIMEPGCMMRNMVVLEGRQGKKKSTALELIGGEWYTQCSISVSKQDFYNILTGKMLIEFAELDAFGNAEQTRIKQVISSPKDTYRKPYGRFAEDHPRMCVFAGSTNEDAWQKDHTGGTRFWPIKCHTIDTAVIRANRDQLFAEAVVRYRAGESWWEMPDSAAEEQDARRSPEAWEDALEPWLLSHAGSEITVMNVYKDCLKGDASKLPKNDVGRIERALTALGWKRQRSVRGRAAKWIKASDDED